MSDATDLWDAVVASYPATDLLTLTNIRDPSATAIDTTAGVAASQATIDLWGLYAQAAYDGTSAAHVEVAKRGVIAMLFSRGGTASELAKVEWESVYGSGGLLERVQRTGARGRIAPQTNSNTATSSDLLADGTRPLGWSDRAALPLGILPSRRSSAGG